MDEDSSTEQKTWHVYSLGKRHVFRLHWNESREGFCTYLTYTLVFKRADRGRMADRNRASVPNNWSLVRQRTLTTGLCSEGWYSEHSGVCIILSEVTLCGWPIVKIRELTNCNTFVMRWPRAIDTTLESAYYWLQYRMRSVPLACMMDMVHWSRTKKGLAQTPYASFFHAIITRDMVQWCNGHKHWQSEILLCITLSLSAKSCSNNHPIQEQRLLKYCFMSSCYYPCCGSVTQWADGTVEQILLP